MLVVRNEAKRQRVIGGPLDLTAGVATGGATLNQQREQQRRVVRKAASPGIGPLQRAEIKPLDDLNHVARQVPLGQPILHRRWQQKVDRG